MNDRRFDSFDPDIPDGLQVEVFDYPPLPEAEREALHGMIAAGNKLIAAMNAHAQGGGTNGGTGG